MTQNNSLISLVSAALYASKAGEIETAKRALEAASAHPGLRPGAMPLNERLACQGRIADALRSEHPKAAANAARLVKEHLSGTAHEKTKLERGCRPAS